MDSREAEWAGISSQASASLLPVAWPARASGRLAGPQRDITCTWPHLVLVLFSFSLRLFSLSPVRLPSTSRSCYSSIVFPSCRDDQCLPTIAPIKTVCHKRTGATTTTRARSTSQQTQSCTPLYRETTLRPIATAVPMDPKPCTHEMQHPAVIFCPFSTFSALHHVVLWVTS